MTMIERVARAIFDADNGLDGDRIGDMLYEDYRIDGPAENAKEETMMVCRMAARAAIEAMREPTLEQKRGLIRHRGYDPDATEETLESYEMKIRSINAQWRRG